MLGAVLTEVLRDLEHVAVQGMGHDESTGEGGDGRSASEEPCVEGATKVLDETEDVVSERLARTKRARAPAGSCASWSTTSALLLRKEKPVRGGGRVVGRAPLC